MGYLWLNLWPILAAGLAGILPLALVWRPVALPIALIASTWIAAILAGALILAPVPAGVWVVTLVTPAILWAGFILPALLVTMAARGVPCPQTLADAGAWLAALLAQAVVLRSIGLTPLS